MNVAAWQKQGRILTPALLVLFVFFIPISPSLKSIFFALALASILFNPFYRNQLSYAFNTYWAKSALLFLAWAALACLWSPAPLALKMTILSKYSKLFYLPLLAVGFIDRKTRFWSIQAYLLAMVFTCIVALLKVNGLVDINDPADPGALFYHHIMTGFMMSIACYGAALYACQFKGRVRALYLFIVMLTSYQILFLNTGRTGYVIYLLLIAVFLVQKLPLKKAFISGVVCLVFLFFAYQISPTLQQGVSGIVHDVQLLQQNQEYTSVGFRLLFHDYARAMWTAHPVQGIGTGGFQYTIMEAKPAFLKFWGPVLTDPHSQYWMTLAEQGLVGLVLLFGFLGSLFYAAFHLKENKAFLVGIIITFCVGSLSDSILCYSAIGYLLMVMSSLCFGEFVERHALLARFSAPAANDEDMHQSNLV